MITNICGDVIAFIDEDKYGTGISSDIVQLYDLILIGKLVFNLGRTAAAKINATLAARSAAREAGTVAAREAVEGATSLLLEAGQRPVGEITGHEMQQFLEDIIADRPEITQLSGAKNLESEALQRTTSNTLREWEYLYNRNVQFVDEGVVQRLTNTPGNLMSLQGDKLMIEKQVLNNPREFFNETAHELAADPLNVRGQHITDLPYIQWGLERVTRSRNVDHLANAGFGRHHCLHQAAKRRCFGAGRATFLHPLAWRMVPRSARARRSGD